MRENISQSADFGLHVKVWATSEHQLGYKSNFSLSESLGMKLESTATVIFRVATEGRQYDKIIKHLSNKQNTNSQKYDVYGRSARSNLLGPS